jgi:hypothetical protein
MLKVGQPPKKEANLPASSVADVTMRRRSDRRTKTSRMIPKRTSYKKAMRNRYSPMRNQWETTLGQGFSALFVKPHRKSGNLREVWKSQTLKEGLVEVSHSTSTYLWDPLFHRTKKCNLPSQNFQKVCPDFLRANKKKRDSSQCNIVTFMSFT